MANAGSRHRLPRSLGGLIVLTDGEQHGLYDEHLERLDENVLRARLDRGVGLFDRGVVAGLARVLPHLLGLVLENDWHVRLGYRDDDEHQACTSEGEEHPEEIAPTAR